MNSINIIDNSNIGYSNTERNNTTDTMDGGEAMYKMFYFFLFSYAIYTCLSACFRAADRSSARAAQTSDDRRAIGELRAVENAAEELTAEETSKRQELVRGRLEFRKILASGKATEPIPEKSHDPEKGPEISVECLELLTEMGFGANASKKALQAVGGSDTAAAMDWILDHPDVEEAPPKKSPAAAAASSSSTIPTGSEDDDKNKDNAAEDPALSADNRFDSGVRSIWNSFTFFNRVGSLTDTKHEECCSICLEPYVAGDIVARLKTNNNNNASGNPDNNHDEESNGRCNHWFHEDCILEWLQNHDECPLCRKDMIHNSS